MMRILKGMLPNIAIALNVTMLVVYYLDMRNPMMGFLVGTPFYALAFVTAVCSIFSAVLLYISYRKTANLCSSGKKEKNEA